MNVSRELLHLCSSFKPLNPSSSFAPRFQHTYSIDRNRVRLSSKLLGARAWLVHLYPRTLSAPWAMYVSGRFFCWGIDRYDVADAVGTTGGGRCNPSCCDTATCVWSAAICLYWGLTIHVCSWYVGAFYPTIPHLLPATPLPVPTCCPAP